MDIYHNTLSRRKTEEAPNRQEMIKTLGGNSKSDTSAAEKADESMVEVKSEIAEEEEEEDDDDEDEDSEDDTSVSYHSSQHLANVGSTAFERHQGYFTGQQGHVASAWSSAYRRQHYASSFLPPSQTNTMAMPPQPNNPYFQPNIDDAPSTNNSNNYTNLLFSYGQQYSYPPSYYNNLHDNPFSQYTESNIGDVTLNHQNHPTENYSFHSQPIYQPPKSFYPSELAHTQLVTTDSNVFELSTPITIKMDSNKTKSLSKNTEPKSQKNLFIPKTRKRSKKQRNGKGSLENRSAETEVGSTSSGQPKQRRRIATVEQRRAANVRERKRMLNLNESFNVLRSEVPTFAYERKLSRIETLRLAIMYIKFLTEIAVNGKHPSEISLYSKKAVNRRTVGCEK